MTTQWQPIETAPKDGTEILIYYRFSACDGGAMQCAKFRGAKIISTMNHDALSGFSAPGYGVTHWMPLPQPPEVAVPPDGRAGVPHHKNSQRASGGQEKGQ